MEELKRFEEDLKENEELRKKFVDFIKTQNENGVLKNESTARFANENGYNKSVEDVEKASIEKKELNDEAAVMPVRLIAAFFQSGIIIVGIGTKSIFCCTVFYIDPTCNNHC